MRALPMILAATALALVLPSAAWADPGHAGHDHAVEAAHGRPGDPAKGGRVIQVVMKETDNGMAFAPERIEVRQGEQVQFVLRNGGELDHELVKGTIEANNEHAHAMAAIPTWPTRIRTLSASARRPPACCAGSSPRPGRSSTPA